MNLSYEEARENDKRREKNQTRLEDIHAMLLVFFEGEKKGGEAQALMGLGIQ
jgi:hypothetical protein